MYLQKTNKGKDKKDKVSIINDESNYIKKFDSGIVTLYNPKVLELLYIYKAEDFGKDTSKYLYLVKTKVRNKFFFKKRFKIKKGIGTPFVLCKFKIISTQEIFYALNTC